MATHETDRATRLDRHLNRRRTLAARAQVARFDELEYLTERREVMGR